MKQFTKLFFLLLFFSPLLHANQQLIVVISEDMNSSTAILTRYELKNLDYKQVGQSFKVIIGRSGLAWGIGLDGLKNDSSTLYKKEGDGKSPAGIFNITTAFGYTATLQSKMPYINATDDLICVDDSDSKDYNKIVLKTQSDDPKSFEWMKRKDNLYEYGLVIEHNKEAKAQGGSCIFFHIKRKEETPTAGCTAMSRDELLALISWLDLSKKPKVIQIPRSKCLEAQDLFRGISCTAPILE